MKTKSKKLIDNISNMKERFINIYIICIFDYSRTVMNARILKSRRAMTSRDAMRRCVGSVAVKCAVASCNTTEKERRHRCCQCERVRCCRRCRRGYF